MSNAPSSTGRQSEKYVEKMGTVFMAKAVWPHGGSLSIIYRSFFCNKLLPISALLLLASHL